MRLRCNKILITGGGSGIGFAIAKRLLQDDTKVVIAGRNVDKLEIAKNELNSENVFILQLDVQEVESFPEKIKQASDMMNGLNGLVNCAGIELGNALGRGYEPWDITKDEWNLSMNTNLRGMYFLTRDIIDIMREKHIKGNILNISSNAPFLQVLGTYGFSKEAIIRMTRSFGKMFAPDGIIINGIAPGITYTDMTSEIGIGINERFERAAIKRIIRPDEIAELAHYLMSDYGEIICGHTVLADGGDSCAI